MMMNSQEVFIKLKVTEQELINTVQELKSIKFAIDQASIVSITDHRGYITYVNERFCEVAQYSRDELLGKSHRIVNSGIHSKEYFDEMWRMISSGRTWKGEICNRTKDGTFYWVDAVIVPFLDSNNRPYQYVSIRNNITKRKLAEQKIEKLMLFDELTGLPNRKHFTNMVQQEIKKATPFSLFVVNIERFTVLNDTFGHDIGDRILLEMARRLKTLSSTKISRITADEFAFIVNNLKKEEINEFNHYLIQTLQTPFNIEGYELNIAFKVGITHYPDEGTESHTLINNCRMAMKNHRKVFDDPICSYSNDFSNIRAIQLANDLKSAIEKNQLKLFYQPRVAINSGIITSAEALIRWQHPEWGLVDPNEFLPLAEEVGLVVPISDWILKTVCLQNKIWQKKGYNPIVISVNFSPRHFIRRDMIANIQKILEETELDPKWLEIEISENMTYRTNPFIYKSIIALKKLGVRIALDDFGTGYSSLMDLKMFDIDYVKLDRQFVKDIDNNLFNEEIIRSMLELCHKLNKKVVVEGVERKEELAVLTDMNFPMEVQGFLFSRPISDEQFEMLIMKGVCKPKSGLSVDGEQAINKRKYYRIDLPYPMVSKITTLKKEGNLEKKDKEFEILIDNIGPGGIRFLTGKEIVQVEDTTMQFEIKVLNAKMELDGRIVHGKTLSHGIYAYGVEFIMPESKRDYIISILNTLAVNVKRLKFVPESNMIKEDKIRFLLEKDVL